MPLTSSTKGSNQQTVPSSSGTGENVLFGTKIMMSSSVSNPILFPQIVWAFWTDLAITNRNLIGKINFRILFHTNFEENLFQTINSRSVKDC